MDRKTGTPTLMIGRMRWNPRAILRSVLLHWKRSLESQLAEIDGAASRIQPAGPACESKEDAYARGVGTELGATLQKLALRYPGRALVAYGSRVSSEADASSDLDVLVIEYDRNLPPVHETVQLQGVKIDLTRVGFNVVLKGLRARGRLNNRWFLNALRRCYLYGDRDGEARRLVEAAEEIWREGPHPLTQKQLEAGRVGLHRLLDSAARLSLRSADSPEAAKLARMRCDQLVAYSVYMFYCVRGRWTTSLHRLLGRCKTEFPEFYSLWLRYASSFEPAETISVAKRIVDAVHEGCSDVSVPLADDAPPTDAACARTK